MIPIAERKELIGAVTEVQEVYLTKKYITELLVRSCENSHGVVSKYVMTQNLCSSLPHDNRGSKH